MSVYFFQAEEGHRQEIFPGVSISTKACEKMMLSYAVFDPKTVVPRHSHVHEQVGVVLKGSVIFKIGEDEKKLEPGEMFTIPGGVEHEVVAGIDGAEVLDIFHPVREEYLR